MSIPEQQLRWARYALWTCRKMAALGGSEQMLAVLLFVVSWLNLHLKTRVVAWSSVKVRTVVSQKRADKAWVVFWVVTSL